MRCYLTKTGCVDRLLELGAHLSLIRGPHTLHYCPRCSAGVNSLTYKKLIWSYLEMCSQKMLLLDWKHVLKELIMSAVVRDSKSGHASTALQPSLGVVVKERVFCFGGNGKRPPSWVSPECLIRAIGQVQLGLVKPSPKQLFTFP